MALTPTRVPVASRDQSHFSADGFANTLAAFAYASGTHYVLLKLREDRCVGAAKMSDDWIPATGRVEWSLVDWQATSHWADISQDRVKVD